MAETDTARKKLSVAEAEVIDKTSYTNNLEVHPRAALPHVTPPTPPRLRRPAHATQPPAMARIATVSTRRFTAST